MLSLVIKQPSKGPSCFHFLLKENCHSNASIIQLSMKLQWLPMSKEVIIPNPYMDYKAWVVWPCFAVQHHACFQTMQQPLFSTIVVVKTTLYSSGQSLDSSSLITQAIPLPGTPLVSHISWWNVCCRHEALCLCHFVTITLHVHSTRLSNNKIRWVYRAASPPPRLLLY